MNYLRLKAGVPDLSSSAGYSRRYPTTSPTTDRKVIKEFYATEIDRDGQADRGRLPFL